MRKLLVIILACMSSISLYAQSYEELINKSADYLEKKDYAAAEIALKEAMRREPANPGNTLLLTNLGTVQRELGKKNDAMISYSAALASSPKATFVLHNRAALYCDMNDFENALKDYNAILLVDDKDIEAYYRRGLLNIERNNLPAAMDDFQKIEDIDADNIHSELGTAMIYKHQKDWKKSEELYSDLIYKYRRHAILYYNRAECYAGMNRNGKAIDDLNKAIDLGYDDPAIYIMRGQLRLNQYDKLAAKLDFTKAKELGVDKDYIDELISKCK